VEVFALNENQFFLKVVEAQLTFERDAAGKATAVKLLQGPVEVRGLRK
jgi:hypothetical protein